MASLIPPPSLSLTSSVPLTFSCAFSEKHNGDDFLLWLQQIASYQRP